MWRCREREARRTAENGYETSRALPTFATERIGSKRMKSRIRIALLLAFALHASLISALANKKNEGYSIEIHIPEVFKAGDTVLLGYYYSDGRYVQDSAIAETNRVRFSGDSLLDEGMYFVLLPRRNYFDLLIGQNQKFTLRAESLDVASPSTTVQGAPMVKDFLLYQHELMQLQKQFQAIRKLDSTAQAENSQNPQLTEAYGKAANMRKEASANMEQYVNRVLENHRDDMLGKFILSTKDVDIPEPPATVKDAHNPDSAAMVWRLYYYAQHYMDNVDLSYPGLLRTPTLEDKINHYLDKILLSIPDTISRYCDTLLERASRNERTMRYLSTFLLNKYQVHELMGMDAVFVHIADNYFLKGRTPWISDELIAKIRERADALRPNLIGKKAPSFIVDDIFQRPFNLYNVKAKTAIVLVFWEPGCSHCRVAVPKIDSTFKAYQGKGVEIIGFMTQGDGPKWAEYIKEHRLTGWHHVWDPYRKSNFDKNYDIYSTPVIFILKPDFTIFAKRIGAEQVGPIIEELIKVQDKKK